LAGKGIVSAAASHYGVWKACKGNCKNSYPVDYFSPKSSPMLALHGKKDRTQTIEFFIKHAAKLKTRPKLKNTFTMAQVMCGIVFQLCLN